MGEVSGILSALSPKMHKHLQAMQDRETCVLCWLSQADHAKGCVPYSWPVPPPAAKKHIR